MILELIFLISAIFSFLLGFFVYYIGKKSAVPLSFFTSAVFFGLWIFTNLCSGVVGSPIFPKLTYGIGSFLPVTTLIFTCMLYYGSLPKRNLFIHYGVAFVFFLLSFTPLFINRITSVTLGSFEGKYGALFYFWATYVFSVIGLNIFLLIKFYIKSSGLKKLQLKYLAIGMGGMGVFIIISDVILPLFDNKLLMTFDSLSVLFYLVVTAYAIARYRLMDIRVAFTRTAIFLVIYSLVMWLPFWVGYKTQSWVLSAAFMAIFATGGPIIHRLLQRKAENMLMAQQKRYQRALIDAGRGMVREHDIKKLMRLIVRVVRFSVKVDFVCAFILDKQNHCYKIAALRGEIQFPEHFTMSDEHDIVAMIKKHRAILTYEEINSNKDKPLGKEIHLIVPAFSTDKLLGFIVMGEKENKSVYSQEDIDVFSILSHQASLAMENCMFVEDTKESERRLFQAEKLASIGGMADGVAHQIKNRLNHFSIASGEAQFEIKDFIKAHQQLVDDNPDLKKTFDYLLKITESLVGNVKRTNSIIQGILNYARVEEKDTYFSVFTIAEIMNLSLDLLMVKHEVAVLPITHEVDGLDEIYGIKAQVMEAVYNVLDNCYESVNERFKYHTPQEDLDKYQMKVHLKLSQTPNNTIIEISDNGMGIKEEDRHKIFAPFFTTKSSYKSGSGIGMYVVKRMVEENHHGKIYFESKPMEGARFIIELPRKT